ncbi:MAG: hypothetical protein ACK4N5_06095 [Myxococcales bacterium]
MKRIILSAVVALGLSACGGQPLTVWRVSGFSNNDLACKAGSQDLPKSTETVSATNSQGALGTWEIYEGPETEAGEATFFLVGPSIKGPKGSGTYNVIQGTFKDDVYTFDSIIEHTDKDKLDNTTRTEVRKLQNTITLNMKGSGNFTGSWKTATTNTCSGTGCDPDFNKQNVDCTSSSSLVGTKVEPILERDI